MKKIFQFLMLLLSVIAMGACTPYYRQHAISIAGQHLAEFPNYIANNDYISAYWKADQVIQSGDTQQIAQARELISGDDFGRGIEAQILNNTNQYFNVDTIGEFESLLSALKYANKYINTNHNSITEKMQKNTKRQVASGAVPVTFQDIKKYGFLKTKEIMPLAYKASIEELRQTVHPMLLEATLELVQDPLCISCPKNFKNDAKKLKYNKSMIENQQFSMVAGAQVVNTLSQSIPALFLSFDQNDRLMELDVSSALTSSENIRIVSSEGKNTYTAKVSKLAYDERVTPERSQTVVYDYFQCDPMLAILYMPRNASYMYEYVTSAASVEYAYEITLYKGKQKISDRLIRDTVSDSTSFCRNARVQNVFGAISPAAFIANSHMQSQCSGRSEQKINPASLKKQVQNTLARALETMVTQQP